MIIDDVKDKVLPYLELYPNPTADFINIPDGFMLQELVDVNGKVLVSEIDTREWKLIFEEKKLSTIEQPYKYSYLTYKR